MTTAEMYFPYPESPRHESSRAPASHAGSHKFPRETPVDTRTAQRPARRQSFGPRRTAHSPDRPVGFPPITRPCHPAIPHRNPT